MSNRPTQPTDPPKSLEDFPAPPPFAPDRELIGDMERPEGPMDPEPRRRGDTSDRD